MCFIRRLILSNISSQIPLIHHFENLSSFILLNQINHSLRFYHYEKELGQIKLLPTHISSIVIMNDGSLVLSNNTRNLIQFVFS